MVQCFYTNGFDNHHHHHHETGFIAPRLLKSMSTLNKHNRVLSSRKSINALESGMYDFDIRLRPANDTMRLRIILLPPATTKASLLNYLNLTKSFISFHISPWVVYSYRIVISPRKNYYRLFTHTCINSLLN